MKNNFVQSLVFGSVTKNINYNYFKGECYNFYNLKSQLYINIILTTYLAGSWLVDMHVFSFYFWKIIPLIDIKFRLKNFVGDNLEVYYNLIYYILN